MSLGQELWKAVSKRRPDAVCLGGVCYIRLDDVTLAKAELFSKGGNYDGLRLTVLNRYAGPVDSLSIHSWDIPRREQEKAARGEQAGWDIYRPTLDIGALWELAEQYLRLFEEQCSETR